MRTFTRIAILTIALFFVAAKTGAQPAAGTSSQTTGTISGRVTIDDRAAPSGIVIALLAFDYRYVTERGVVARARTDAEGRFRLTNVPAGRFRIVPLAPSLYALDSTAEHETGKLITMIEGETVDDVELALARGGVITGRVTDADGRPVIEEIVHLSAIDERDNNRLWRNSYDWRTRRTDDRGVYRIYGLPAGRFRVSVGRARDSGQIGFSPAGVFARTFAPGVAEESEASIITIEPGTEATNVNIIVGRREQTFTASGRIVDAETNQPVPNVGYGYGALIQGRRISSTRGGMLTNVRGEFRIEGITPGRYAAFAFSPPGASENSDWYGEPVNFEVTDGDVHNLEIKLRRGASISGTVVVEGTSDVSISAQLSQLQLYAMSEGNDSLSVPHFNIFRIGADGGFRTTGLPPGRVRLQVSAYQGPRGFTFLRVERDGVEQREGIEVASGGQITGVRVVLGYGTGVVRGQVQITNGTLPAGARLYVQARRVGSEHPQAGTETDARGRFIFEELMAGDYEFFTQMHFTSMADTTPRQRRPPVGRQTVTVRDGVESQITINLDLNADEQQ